MKPKLKMILKLGLAAASVATLAGCGDSRAVGTKNQNQNNNENNTHPDGGLLCGNGVIDPREECDDGAANSDTTPDACRTDCSAPHCGDHVADSGEECDGSDLKLVLCTDLPPFTGGTLACASDCTFDTSGCHDCGDGVLDPGEECDGQDLNGRQCQDWGFSAGILGCRPDCTFDFSQCAEGCGNGIVDIGEGCDDGNNDNTDACPDDPNGTPPGTCLPATCGDGHIWNQDGGTEQCDDGNGVEWDGCSTECLIVEFQVNTYTAGDQSQPAVAVAADGSFVVAWESDDQDGDSLGVYGHRYDDAGGRLGGEFQISSYTTRAQQDPSVGVADDGSFVVVWSSSDQDGDRPGVYGQRYGAGGGALGGEFMVNSHTANTQAFPAAGVAADGSSIVLVWMSNGQDGSIWGIYGQRYDSVGTPVGGEFQVNSYTVGYQYGPAVGATPDGGFVVVWQSQGQDGSGSGIFGRRYDNAGSPLGGEFQINSYTAGDQQTPAIGMAADGTFVVVWESDGQDGHLWGVYGQRYDPDGIPVGGEFKANSYTAYSQKFAAVGVADDGRFVVVWESDGQNPVGSDVYGQRYDGGGVPQGGEFRANVYSTSVQGFPAVDAAGDGGFVVVWASWGQDWDEYGVFAQRYDASGNPLGVGP